MRKIIPYGGIPIVERLPASLRHLLAAGMEIHLRHVTEAGTVQCLHHLPAHVHAGKRLVPFLHEIPENLILVHHFPHVRVKLILFPSLQKISVQGGGPQLFPAVTPLFPFGTHHVQDRAHPPRSMFFGGYFYSRHVIRHGGSNAFSRRLVQFVDRLFRLFNSLEILFKVHVSGCVKRLKRGKHGQFPVQISPAHRLGSLHFIVRYNAEIIGWHIRIAELAFLLLGKLLHLAVLQRFALRILEKLQM